MSDYQAIYDAVRSKISGGDIGSVVREVAFSAFDIGWEKEAIKAEFLNVAFEQQRPSVLMRPQIMVDGNQWCALYGDDLQNGVAGFGDSPAEAFFAFDKAWAEKLPQNGSTNA